MILGLLWGACADEELRDEARSLRAWEEGAALLEEGDAAGARERFAAASEIRPSPLLDAWHARALAAEGRTEEAAAMLGQVVERVPSFAEARYNRAAYLARLGRPDEAAAELQRAIADGAARSLQVLEDPDFEPYLDHPAFVFLPRAALTVGFEPPPPTAFWGSETALRLRLLGIVRPPIRVETSGSGPLQLVSLVEDTVHTSQGRGVDLLWTWKVLGAGRAEVGPTVVHAGRYSATVDAFVVDAQAPPDKPVPEPRPVDLPTVAEAGAGLEERSARYVDGRLVARARPQDRVTTEPPSTPVVRFDRRELGAPVEVVWWWPPGPAPQKVTITSPEGERLFDAAP